MMVIKRYINHTFGLELYERLADPTNDIVSKIETRGISGNLSAQSRTFWKDHKLIDALSFLRIPQKLYIELRSDLKEGHFSFIDFRNSERVYVEISSSFFLKQKLTFEETHMLFQKMNELWKASNKSYLSNFYRVTGDSELKRLNFGLYDVLRDDMMRTIPVNNNPYGIQFDLDFVHPSKLQTFYECDEYLLFARNARKPFFATQDRKELYKAGLAYLYETIDINNQVDFIKSITGIRVNGIKGGQRMTTSTFIYHITCELSLHNGSYFLIDTRWYRLKGNFISSINSLCTAIIKANILEEDFLSVKWNGSYPDEGSYNLAYLHKKGFLVLDKALGQNIELCDLLYSTEETTYLIHIKDKFDAKIRDLTNQISIANNRLWNDLKSEGDTPFLNLVFDSYNSTNNIGGLSNKDFRDLFKRNIVFVMAFRPKRKGTKTVGKNVHEFKSNIAKFSLIQCFREIQSNNYPLKIFEIPSE